MSLLMNTSAKHSDLTHQQRPVGTHLASSTVFLKQTCLLSEICLFSVSTRPPSPSKNFRNYKTFKLFTSWPPSQLKEYILHHFQHYDHKGQRNLGKRTVRAVYNFRQTALEDTQYTFLNALNVSGP